MAEERAFHRPHRTEHPSSRSPGQRIDPQCVVERNVEHVDGHKRSARNELRQSPNQQIYFWIIFRLQKTWVPHISTLICGIDFRQASTRNAESYPSSATGRQRRSLKLLLDIDIRRCFKRTRATPQSAHNQPEKRKNRANRRIEGLYSRNTLRPRCLDHSTHQKNRLNCIAYETLRKNLE
jgi:hypothetical protein